MTKRKKIGIMKRLDVGFIIVMAIVVITGSITAMTIISAGGEDALYNIENVEGNIVYQSSEMSGGDGMLGSNLIFDDPTNIPSADWYKVTKWADGYFQEDLEVNRDFFVNNDLQVTGDISASVVVTDVLTQGGGKRATSTVNSTATLLASDFDTESYIEMTPNSAALTLTLPATSTLSALIPNDGDFRTVWLKNSTTTSGITITLVAGAGMDLQEQNGQDLIIDDEDWGKMTFLRLTNTDMMVLFEEFIKAD